MLVMANTARKKSPIWSFYSVGEDSKFAVCNGCGQKVSHGGATTKTYNTSNLVSHLKSKHREQYAEFEKQKAGEGQEEQSTNSAKARQLTLKESDERVRLWDVNDARAHCVHRRIGEMIALDCQPFSVVQDVGFVRLLNTLEPRYSVPSRRYITETILPRIKDGVASEVRKAIAGVQWFSFTTDIWSTEVSNDSLLSLTAHWLTDSFKPQSAVLHAQTFPGAHTGEMICGRYTEMLKGWGIKKEQLHLIVRDNTANMVKAMRDAGYPDLGCFAHTLQLIVHDGVLSQRSVKDTISVCRQIVGHFKCSPLAYSRLNKIQDNLELPKHRLIQDEPTRWNSTLYMLQNVAEQKMALAAYSTEGSIPSLTPNQLNLISKVIAVLNPIQEITKSISTDAASLSLIIPFIRALRKTLENHDDDSRVQTMKSDMLTSLNRRYKDVESDVPLALATLLDPRFKDKFFSGANKRANAKQLLDQRVAELSHREEPREPSPKRPKTDVLKCFSEILEEAGVEADSSYSTVVDKYLSEPLIPFHRGNAYSWWAENKLRFPPLVVLAMRYLSAHLRHQSLPKDSFLKPVISMTKRGTVSHQREQRCCYSLRTILRLLADTTTTPPTPPSEN